MSTTNQTPLSYDTCRAAHQRLVRVLMSRMPKTYAQAALNELAVPTVRGKPMLKHKGHLDVVMDYTVHGYTRGGRNYAEQMLTPNWPADPIERVVLHAAANARYVFAQVNAITPQVGVTMTEVMGTQLEVTDHALSRSAKVDGGLSGYIMRLPGVTMLTGASFVLSWQLMLPRLEQARKAGVLFPLDATLTPDQKSAQSRLIAVFISSLINE